MEPRNDHGVPINDPWVCMNDPMVRANDSDVRGEEGVKESRKWKGERGKLGIGSQVMAAGSL